MKQRQCLQIRLLLQHNQYYAIKSIKINNTKGLEQKYCFNPFLCYTINRY